MLIYGINMINDYSPGHCWYYRLKGAVLSLKEILATVKSSGYESIYKAKFMRDNEKDDRTIKLLEHKKDSTNRIKDDISAYRKYCFYYHKLKEVDPNDMESHMDLCVSLSLKYCHIYNRFADLILLDNLLNGSDSGQSDMFGF